MKLTFKQFGLIYCILISMVILLCLPSSFAEFSSIGLTGIFSVLIRVGIHIIGKKTAAKIKIKFDEPDSRELEREDDVLLQSVTFASSILFFYINLFYAETPERFVLSFGLAFLSISFYLLRACGKIRNSPKLRYYSIFLFFFLVSLYFFGISIVIVEEFFRNILVYPYRMILLSPIIAVYFSLRELSKNFKKRYGYKD